MSTRQLIRDHRLAHGWSMERLAREANISTPTVYRAENGRHEPSMLTLSKLERALGLDRGELVNQPAPSEPGSRGAGRSNGG